MAASEVDGIKKCRHAENDGIGFSINMIKCIKLHELAEAPISIAITIEILTISGAAVELVAI